MGQAQGRGRDAADAVDAVGTLDAVDAVDAVDKKPVAARCALSSRTVAYLNRSGQAEIAPQILPDTVGNGHEQEGVAADVEEPVLHADLVRVQHGLPDGQHLGFERRLRRHDGPVPGANHLTWLRAWRLILPLSVRGMLSSSTNAAGTIYSGRVALSCWRNWRADTAPGCVGT